MRKLFIESIEFKTLRGESMNQYVFRYAEESDAVLVLYFIKEFVLITSIISIEIALKKTFSKDGVRKE